MFRIGDFAALGRVSSRALRLYDSAGLLAPARVDPLTGYRSYAADQLPRLHRILALREAGLGLAAIRELLDGELSADQVAAVLRAPTPAASAGRTCWPACGGACAGCVPTTSTCCGCTCGIRAPRSRK